MLGAASDARPAAIHTALRPDNLLTSCQEVEDIPFSPQQVSAFHQFSPRFFKFVWQPIFLKGPHWTRPSRTVR